MQRALLLSGACLELLSCGRGPDAGLDALECAEAEVLELEWLDGALVASEGACASLRLLPRVLGEGDFQVELIQTDRGSWRPEVSSVSGGVFYGLVLEGSWSLVGDREEVLWKQGYQSWSWSGVTRPGEPSLDAWGVIETEGDASSVAMETDFSSWWVGLVGRPEGASLLLGVESAQTTPFFMGLNGSELQAVWGHRGDRISMDPASTLELDPVWIGQGSDALRLMEVYGDRAAAATPPRGLDSRPPTGWATWYQYYSEVHEEDVRENLEALVELQRDPALSQVDVFQIDDGWQARWGDWWAGDDFPSGMKTIAEDISAAGMTPGLWMAPFYMSMDSETFTNNPDWWVLDAEGEPIYFSNLGTGDYVVLDPTHPEAAEWLSRLVSEKVAEGYGYLKLDFLYAAAMPGQRHKDVTGMQAFHEGMSIVRQAAGDAWILACGAPLLPSLGYAESFRTGADIAFESSPDPDPGYYRWQARTTAARSWTQGRWWWMDPDQLIIRDPLNETQVRGAIASALVAGGTWMLGDDLVSLAKSRVEWALNPELLERLGQQASYDTPLEWVSGVDAGPIIEKLFPNDRVPPSWRLEDGTTVLMNWGDEPLELDTPGGTNWFTGESSGPGLRSLAPGDAEIWIP